MRKLKLFAFLLALVASVGMSWATSQPVGYVDVCTAHPGSIHLVGWANDPDALGTSLPIHVYVDQPNGGSSYINQHGYNLGTTDVWREDGVNPQYTGYHKIDRYINIMEASGAGTYRIRAYALDAVGNDGNPLMRHSYLNGMPTTATLTVPAPYSITYNANGGNGAPAADYKCYGIDKTLSSTVPTRDGYTFIGWNTEQNGSGESYAAAGTYTANAGATLYAQWKVTEVTVNLSTITSDYVIPNGAILTGTLQNNVVLTVANNATITLNNVNINWNAQWTGGDHAGITCENATIILAECTTNKIRGFLDGNPGVYVVPGKTLTIQGTGTLYAATNGGAAAIGSGYGPQNSSRRDGGNIIIKDGTIYANGGNLGAGIGSGGRSKVGNITIQGGIITATGGGSGAGIGCGQTRDAGWKASCGNITITNGVKYLKATKGSGAAHSIGKGNNSGTAVCGTVTINGTTGAISNSPYTYSPAADNVKNLINAIGSVAYTQACKDKIDAARAAYDALADYTCDADAVNTIKALVTNYSTLTNAEAAYDQAAANYVIGLINAIGTVEHNQESRDKIDAALEAYDALTNEQKALVTNHDTLTQAEQTYQDKATVSEMSNRFEYNYDCQRYPAYPRKDQACSLSGFKNPYVGYKGIGNPSSTGNVSDGPWKLDFVGYYHSENDYGCNSVVNNVVNNYFSGLSSAEKEAKKSEVPIFHLLQWNPTAQQYQSAAYGVVCAYESMDAGEHAALFISSSNNGCFLSGEAHSSATQMTPDEDITTGLADLIVAASVADPDQDAADPVIELIDQIPNPVVYTVACKDAIDAARNAYDALTNTQKPHVTNYSKLTDAEAAFNALVVAADQAAANSVKDLINAIGTVTTGSGPAITDARNAYDDLTDIQKDLVDNYNTLLDAEATYADLMAVKNVEDLIDAIGTPIAHPTSGPAIAAARDAYENLTDEEKAVVNSDKLAALIAAENAYYDMAAADAVKDLIDAIGTVTINSGSDITAARNAYDALTNAQKSYVDNYSTLTDAEAAYAALTPSADPTIFAGFTVTDGCGGFGGEDHTKLVDGKFTSGNEGVDWTKWCADSQHKSVPSGESEACWWVDFNAANPIAVTGYILTTGNDNIPHGAGRNPSSWIIKAKLNENDSWTTIATVSNDNTMQIVNFTDFAFTLDQAGTYKYFRFMVSAPVSGTCMQLCELRFTGNGAPAPTPTINDILQELYDALGNDVWAGYGEQTGVITYAQGTEPNSFKATFMGGAYTIDIPFGDFTQAEKVGNGDGSYTYNLDVNLPAQTGLSHEVLHVTVNSNGEITGIHSDVAQTDMNKVGGSLDSWAALQDAMTAGGVLQLSQSLTATNLDGALIVPAGKTVVLDLNGFSLDRHLASAQENGSVIINNGTLAITDNVGGAEIKGGYNSGNGGGIVNNGTFTLYGGKITGNHAAQGAGVYNSVANDGALGFWMTGGLIAENSASSYPAIKGDVTFSNLAVVQISAGGNTVSAATAIAGLSAYDYIKPVMPNMDMFAILAELHNALGNDVWTGYGVNTGVMSYSQGDEANEFRVSFMGGTYTFDLPFGDFTSATKADNGDGTFTYTLTVNLPAQTGMSQETLHVTTNANGEITAIHSDNAEVDLKKETNGTIATWADLQNALNEGGLIKLTNDIVNGDVPLVIPENTTVVLDLNGHTIDRGMTSAAENGSVIVNNGTLAIVDHSELANGVITGGKTTGNGGGILNNGIFTLYAGEITGNEAAIGGGVYNNGGEQGFWMTGGLIDGNTANSNPAIGGEVIFNENAAVQIDAQGTQVTIAQALAGLATYSYIKPVMPNYDELETDYTLLQELWNALGDDIWTGYGEQTGVISYSRGGAQAFHASFMGGTYAFDLPFAAFTAASKADNGNGEYIYTLTCNLPAQTGLGQETLHVTVNNGNIETIHSDNAGLDMTKEEEVTGWAALQAKLNAGGVVKLGGDVTAAANAEALNVPAGKTVVIDLNGHSIDRNLNAAVANGSVIVNNGTLAIMGQGALVGGNTTGNGGGILNNGILTLYGGEIKNNHANIGGGVYNNGEFWMTAGLIKDNEAGSYAAIGGNVIFNEQAQIQINENGDKITVANALTQLASLTYVQPVMPSYDDLQPADPEALKLELLQELWTALGEDIWTGYGVQTGVISYSRGGQEAFHASFMGGSYAFDLPFAAFTNAEKAANTDGSYTYTLTCNLPAQTGMGQETLHVTVKNGEITELESENAGVELQKETDGTIATWAELQNALNQGGVIKLTNDIVGGDAPLEIPAGKTVVLDLNGHTINRGMTSADANGSVIVNNGTLAIVDNSELANGVITGGKTTGNGGGILNNGIFTLYAGEITGNEATIGGGVYNNGGAQGFWMTGGLIDNNTATTNPAIGGDVIFNNMAQIQINADGDKVSIDEAIAGLSTYGYIQPVMPDYDDYTTEVAIVANADPDNANVYYSTFFDSANKYMLPAGVEAYVADLSGSDLILTKIAGAGQVIPANVAVILKANVQNFSLIPSFDMPVSFSAHNDLEGVDHPTSLESLNINQENCYVLSGTPTYGVGFYKINVDYLKAHKAFVQYTGNQNNAPKRMRFVFNQEQVATGIEDVQGDNVQSTKVLENGVLYIIKNGVRYNVQGQVVK